MHFSGAVFRALRTQLKNPPGRTRKATIAPDGALSYPKHKPPHWEDILHSRLRINDIAHNAPDTAEQDPLKSGTQKLHMKIIQNDFR